MAALAALLRDEGEGDGRDFEGHAGTSNGADGTMLSEEKRGSLAEVAIAQHLERLQLEVTVNQNLEEVVLVVGSDSSKNKRPEIHFQNRAAQNLNGVCSEGVPPSPGLPSIAPFPPPPPPPPPQ